MDTAASNRDDDDNDLPQLSSETLQALQQFYKEQEALKSSEVSTDADNLSIQSTQKGTRPEIFSKDMNVSFPEDWQMSQFWYDDETSNYLANLVKSLVDSDQDRIACLSCPSVFRACGGSINVHLYEYDKRFSKFGSSYFFYDYNRPAELPESSLGSYAVVIADPPFLSEECLEKLTLTVRKLIRPNGKIILCTGAVMEEKAAEYLGLKKTPFVPTHKKNLGNTFACFANFDL